MDEKMVSFICHEADMTRLERANKRLFVVVIILIVALVGSNIAWIYYENSFEDVVTTYVDGITYEKLAEEFDISVAQVKRIIYRHENMIFKNL